MKAMNTLPHQFTEKSAGASIFKKSLGFLLAFACSFAAAAPVNLVNNGSFENGLAGWALGRTDLRLFPPVAIYYGPGTAYPTGAYNEAIPQNNAVTGSPDAAGNRAAYFVSDNANNQSLSQWITIVDAGIYQIGFSAYAPANGYANRYDATFSSLIAGVPLANYAVSTGPAKKWLTFASTANLLAGNYLVEFVFNTRAAPAKDLVIDQVYVVAKSPPLNVPEPGSLALMGLGMAGLAAASRRRKKNT